MTRTAPQVPRNEASAEEKGSASEGLERCWPPAAVDFAYDMLAGCFLLRDNRQTLDELTCELPRLRYGGLDWYQ